MNPLKYNKSCFIGSKYIVKIVIIVLTWWQKILNIYNNISQPFTFYLLRNFLFSSVLWFSIGLFVFLLFYFLSSLFILDIYPLSDVQTVKTFSYSVVFQLVAYFAVWSFLVLEFLDNLFLIIVLFRKSFLNFYFIL